MKRKRIEKYYLIVLGLLTLILYASTLMSKYRIDDNLVIVRAGTWHIPVETHKSSAQDCSIAPYTLILQ